MRIYTDQPGPASDIVYVFITLTCTKRPTVQPFCLGDSLSPMDFSTYRDLLSSILTTLSALSALAALRPSLTNPPTLSTLHPAAVSLALIEDFGLQPSCGVTLRPSLSLASPHALPVAKCALSPCRVHPDSSPSMLALFRHCFYLN